jgi:hypothetical protein
MKRNLTVAVGWSVYGIHHRAFDLDLVMKRHVGQHGRGELLRNRSDFKERVLVERPWRAANAGFENDRAPVVDDPATMPVPGWAATRASSKAWTAAFDGAAIGASVAADGPAKIPPTQT